MQAEIMIYCDNTDELMEFARRVLSRPADNRHIDVDVLAKRNADVFAPPGEPTIKFPLYPAAQGNPAPVQAKRKPRNDKGQVRGPYKNGADAGTTASSTPGTTSDADAVGGDPVTTESPSATPTAAASAPPASAAPATADAQAPEAQRTEPPASAAAEPTFDDARDAMGRINATASLGMPECIAHLASFGINRISLLKKEDFARFIAEANAKIAAVEK
jgi:hypothetical protein